MREDMKDLKVLVQKFGGSALTQRQVKHDLEVLIKGFEDRERDMMDEIEEMRKEYSALYAEFAESKKGE